ncbi:hypothetical protein [Massilia timonae]|uniref:Putative membrane protein n=1 Tax=Massilia timonae TaxID=47229 RepID=A0A1S2NI37_9BURK|nr:hypothetical protein [Massilia timonae]OIJ44082.1 putative membrane protein [Massilia timonae]
MHTVGSQKPLAHKATLLIDLLRVGLATALILLAPLVAMQFTREVAWTGRDFGAAALLLAGAGLACLRTARWVAHWQPWRRLAVVGAVALGFAALWVELAVGVLFDVGS